MKALSKLHLLQNRRLEKESQQLTSLENKCFALQRSLDALGIYQREMSRVPPQGSAFALHNRSIMHTQLGELIEKQYDEQAVAKLSLKQHKKQVLNTFISKKSSEVVLERHRARQALDANRQEQKIMDELAITRARLPLQRSR